jgi:hypothetical protein
VTRESKGQQTEDDAPWGARFRSEFRSELSSIRYPNLGEVASGLVIGVTLILAAGGAIQWIRVDHAGLPATQALAAMPRELFFVVGAKEIALRVLVYWVVYSFMRPAGNVDRGLDRTDKSNWRTRLANGNEWVVGLLYGLALVSLLSFPWGWSAVWGALTALVLAIVIDRGIPTSFGVLLIAGAVLATGQVVTRELDAPVKLNRVSIKTTESTRPASGLLVASTSSVIYFGQQGKLLSIPTTNTSRVIVSDPPPAPPPAESLTGMVFHWIGDRF